MKAAQTKPAPPTLRINLLGTPQVSVCVNGATQVVQCALSAANLLYSLAAHAPRSLSRTKLTGLLYPDHQTQAARKALADATYRLKTELTEAVQALGGDPSIFSEWIAGDASATQLNLALVHLDWLAFKQLAQSNNLADWERALDLYQGHLLEESEAEWVYPLQRPLEDLHVSLLARTCQALSQTSRLPDALALAQQWGLADPWTELPYLAAMRLYARQKRYAQAFQEFDRMARALKTERLPPPSDEARALLQSIRNEAAMLAHTPPQQPENRFVGRRKEYGDLVLAIERTQAGQGGLVLVEGESGMGKTRLLQEMTNGARWRNWVTVWGRTQQHAGTSPCAPLDQALQAAITGPQVDQVRNALSPALLELLSSMVPALRAPAAYQVAAPSPMVPPFSAASAIAADSAGPNWQLQQVDLADAVAAGLLALAQHGPQLFVLDDVQWADNNLWDVLLKLTARLARSPILLVLSYRDNEMRQNAAGWRALQTLDVQLRPDHIQLKGLSADECREMAFALGKRPLSPHEAAQLREATQGKPLFVAGLVGGGENSSAAVSTASFQSVFDDKLISLSPDARRVLEAAAVLGREFSHAAWQAVAGADPGAKVANAMPHLKKLDLVTEGERGYHFPHDFVHEQVYAAIGPEQLRELHKRAVAALQAERAEPGVLAWHAERAGAWREAVRHYRRAGDRAEMAYAHSSALEHYAHGFELLDNLEPQEQRFDRLHLLCRRQLVYGMCLRLNDWQADIEAIETLAEELGATAGLMTALEARMTLALFASDMEGIRAVGDRALKLARAQGNQRTEARIANILAMHMANRLGQAERARKLLQDSVAYASRAKDPLLHVSALCNLSSAQRFCGQCHEAKASALRALTLSQTNSLLNAARADALHALGCAEWFLANWQDAHTALANACQMHSNLNNMWAALDDTLNFTVLNAQMGDFDAAILAMQQLQTLGHRVGLSADSDLWKWADALLADVYVLAGELDKAEPVLAGMADWMDKAIEARQLLSALQTQGRLLLARGQPAQALHPLARAKAIWQKEQTVQVEPLLLHALAAHGAGDGAAAHASLKLAEGRLQRSDAAFANVQLHWVRYAVLGDGPALSQAREELHRQASLFEDAALRTRFLTQIQLHQQVELAWQRHTQSAQAADGGVRQVIVQLARRDVPLGRKLTDEDRVEVIWMVDAGAPDAGVFQQAGKASLRRHRLKRLLEEARACEAAPTDEDLAQALDVQVRTIERDMATLGPQVRGLTRRR